MPEKLRIRTLMHSQHVRGLETLHISSSQYFCHNFLFLWKKVGSKNSLLVVSNILRLFTNSNVIISKPKIFLDFFVHFWNLHKIWKTLKKRWDLEVICFWNYRLEKSGLIKCPKSPMSEHLWTVNMFKGPKDCLNWHRSIFAKFFHQSEMKSAPKILF